MTVMPATRSETARHAILAATSELLATEGYDHLTIEGIAARAKVGKPTIYRWWPSKSALIAECLVDQALLPDTFLPANTGDVVGDITRWLDVVFPWVMTGSNSELIRSLVAAGVDNPQVANELSKRLGATPESLEGRLAAAVESGDLLPDTPVRHITDALIGAIILRSISGEGFADGDAARYVRAGLAGHTTSQT